MRSAKLAALAAAAMFLGGSRVLPREPDAPRAQSPQVVDDAYFARAIARNLPRTPDPELVEVEPSAHDDAALRDEGIRVVRAITRGESVRCALRAEPLRAVVKLHRDGVLVGRGESSGRACVALKDATRRAVAASELAVERTRVVVELPDRGVAFVDHGDRAVELVDGIVPVRVLDRARVVAQLDAGRAYLLRTLDAKRGGAHKYYHASTDRFEDELHTVYTASTAYTLLRLHAHENDPELVRAAERAMTFVLSMQDTTPGDAARGGFFYRFDLALADHDDRMVVGTAAKAIFSLLELHRVTGRRHWLEAARDGADWLLRMQRPDGTVHSSLRRAGSHWTSESRESLLYTGQVLSAWSRLSRVTGDVRYRAAASRTVGHLAARIGREGCHLGDDHRPANPISSSWVVLSLVDFVRATGDEAAERLALRCADELRARQVLGSDDVLREGSFRGSLSSSGVGWLAEVMTEVHALCRERGRERCERFADSAIAAARVILQHAYDDDSALFAKHPEHARGGLFWSASDRRVRTDAVCHATNALLGILEPLGGRRIELAPGAKLVKTPLEHTEEPDD